MRSPLRWLLTLLLALAAALSLPGTAWAANPALSVSPQSAEKGQSVTLTYTLNQQWTCDPQYQDRVSFSIDNQQPFAVRPLTQSCTSTTQYTVPSSATCGSHDFTATFRDANGGEHPEWTATHKLTVKCVVIPTVTIRPTVSIGPSPTRSATPSPTPSATPSPTPSATPSPTATPTPTRTLAPVTSATPVTAVSPPDFSTPGGGSRTPWVVGGAALGLVGLGGSLLLLRPKTGTPIAAGIAGVSVLAGIGLIALAPAEKPKPVISGSYVAGSGDGCAKGDIPINGGYHDLNVPSSLLRFHPVGSSSDIGYWRSSISSGETYTVCLRLTQSVVWTVRDRSLDQTKPTGTVSCQTTESLLSGGFAFPWGIAGLSSYPKPPLGWSASNGPYTDGPAPAASVSALCADLPDGVRTYITSGSTAAPGIATAHCYPGDVVVNGGFSGARVQGSYPVEGGWSAQLGTGGGSAYAVCVKPSRGLGIRSTTVASGDGVATCPGADTVLAGGWSSGTDYNGLQHFHPEGDGWRSETPGPGATAYALCLHRYA